ncbi:cytochrome P450 2L1 [Armadillidium vulgare]|nr:cytochrome P450 2L1 [Armadillidium vulgare]
MYFEIFLFILLILYFVVKTIKNGTDFPGEFGWPIVGYVPPSSDTFLEVVQKLTKKHGKIFTWKMGTRNFIFISDFKSLKEAFTSPQSTNRPSLFTFDAFSNYKRLGFVNNTGQSIQNLRRFTLTHLRNAGMGKSSMENIIRYELECLIKEFKKDAGKPVEIPYSLNVAIINILWKVLADVRFDVSDKKIQEFEKLIADIFVHAQHPLMFIFDQYPILPKLIPHFIQAKLGLAPLFNIWDQLIEFLKAKENGKENEKNFNFTYEELLYCLSDMFSAGSETTASTFRWTVLYLTKYPEVQKKVHEEIDKALPRDRLPTLLDKDK